ncbi:MAG: hypothetical protein K2X11_17820 [Acetobacteraceae bacterium]|nr:hypothetical protein [Acetobacteraceae bacterium]
MTPLRLSVLLAAGLALQGCSTVERGFASVTGTLSGMGDRFGPDWGGMRPAIPTDSVTVQRIRGNMVAETTLQPEPGDVWPEPEGPRATLANPDEALRGIPAWRPGAEPTPAAPPPRRRGSSDLPPDSLSFQPPPSVQAVQPPLPRAPRRVDGQVIPTPSGGVVTTGGTDRVQTTISPQGSGVAIRDGATTTIIGPGGQTQIVPTPR